MSVEYIYSHRRGTTAEWEASTEKLKDGEIGIERTADCSTWDVDKVTTYTNFNTNAPNVTPPVWIN